MCSRDLKTGIQYKSMVEFVSKYNCPCRQYLQPHLHSPGSIAVHRPLDCNYIFARSSSRYACSLRTGSEVQHFHSFVDPRANQLRACATQGPRSLGVSWSQLPASVTAVTTALTTGIWQQAAGEESLPNLQQSRAFGKDLASPICSVPCKIRH